MAVKKQMTSAAKLTDIARGELVELSGWTEDEPFVARLRRASITGLMRAEKIPNPLINAVQKMYEGPKYTGPEVAFEDAVKLVHIIVDDALVEPKMSELDALGVQLTEEQKNEIVAYALQGANNLQRFRDIRRRAENTAPVGAVSGAAVKPAGD